MYVQRSRICGMQQLAKACFGSWSQHHRPLCSSKNLQILSEQSKEKTKVTINRFTFIQTTHNLGYIKYKAIKYFWFRQRWERVGQDKVVLHQFTRGSLTPSPSPFPLKLETYLRMAGIPYEVLFLVYVRLVCNKATSQNSGWSWRAFWIQREDTLDYFEWERIHRFSTLHWNAWTKVSKEF